MSEVHDTEVRVLNPAGWAPAIGYSNGVAMTGRHVVLAGQIGWNPVTTAFESDDFATQVRQALQNISVLLTEAGAEPKHLVRLTWFITNKAAYVDARRAIGMAYREIIGRHFPPMSVVVVSALIEDRAQVEIEATAVVPA